jgi:hypothetical protein
VDADDIGRDIDPATPLGAGSDEKSSASPSAGARAVNEQVAEAMERVGTGLAGTVHN